MARTPRGKLAKLAVTIDLKTAKTPAARYIREHFDELQAVLPQRMNWTVFRDFLVGEGVIEPGTPERTIKTAWHREKERAAKGRRQSTQSGGVEAPASDRANALRQAMAEAPRTRTKPALADDDEPDTRPKFQMARPIGMTPKPASQAKKGEDDGE